MKFLVEGKNFYKIGDLGEGDQIFYNEMGGGCKIFLNGKGGCLIGEWMEVMRPPDYKPSDSMEFSTCLKT